jgi:hypothetical protein
MKIWFESCRFLARDTRCRYTLYKARRRASRHHLRGSNGPFILTRSSITVNAGFGWSSGVVETSAVSSQAGG